MTNKFAYLKDFVYEKDPDIICFTKTSLDSTVEDSEFQSEGYQVFRKDRNIKDYPSGTYEKEERGGVMLMVKGNLNPARDMKGEAEAEILWVRIKPFDNVEWLIGGCYRPEVEEELMFDRICLSMNNVIDTSNTILMGDFNMRNADWTIPCSNREIDKKFIETILDLHDTDSR